jgi:hypothetical protein
MIDQMLLTDEGEILEHVWTRRRTWIFLIVQLDGRGRERRLKVASVVLAGHFRHERWWNLALREELPIDAGKESL